MSLSFPSILSITGSDGTGGTGIQADVQTITALGGKALSAVTCLSVREGKEEPTLYDLPDALVIKQVQSLLQEYRPKAIKVGLVRQPHLIQQLRQELVGNGNIVCDLGMTSVQGDDLLPTEAFQSIKAHLLSIVRILIIRCQDAERLLDMKIQSDDDMLSAAKILTDMGPQWIFLRGCLKGSERITALLYGEGHQQFFSSINVEGWQQHGVGSVLSSALATCLAMGEEVPAAIEKAHLYLHTKMIYVSKEKVDNQRPAYLYNRYMNLLAQHYTEAHDVAFYADKLLISTRYLHQVTKQVSGLAPKAILHNFLAEKGKTLLAAREWSVQEVAQRLGFSNQKQFTELFHLATGMTPSQYRNKELAQP